MPPRAGWTTGLRGALSADRALCRLEHTGGLLSRETDRFTEGVNCLRQVSLAMAGIILLQTRSIYDSVSAASGGRA